MKSPWIVFSERVYKINSSFVIETKPRHVVVKTQNGRELAKVSRTQSGTYELNEKNCYSLLKRQVEALDFAARRFADVYTFERT